MEVNREELYEQVWETPLTRLAPDFNLSDVGLRKVCDRLHVPTPPRGYWAKRQHGQNQPKEPLPELPESASETYVVRETKSAGKTPEDSHEAVSNEPDEEADKFTPPPVTIPEVTVPTKLRNPHPLVVQTREALTGARVDRYGRLEPRDPLGVSLNVSENTLDRALRLSQALIDAAEYLEWPVRDARSGEASRSHLVIAEEEIPFRITEKTDRHENGTTDDVPEWRQRTYRYELTGRLYLKLYFPRVVTPRCRKRWIDQSRSNLEDRIATILKGMHEAAYALKRRRQEREERLKRMRERLRREREQERRQREERKRREQLEGQAERWSKAERLRAFIKEVEQRAKTESVGRAEREAVQEWLRWARDHADRIDPLSERLPSRRVSQ